MADKVEQDSDLPRAGKITIEIETEEDYDRSVERAAQLIDCDAGSAEEEELNAIIQAIELWATRTMPPQLPTDDCQ